MPPPGRSNLRCSRRLSGEGEMWRWSLVLVLFMAGAFLLFCGGNHQSSSTTPAGSIGVADQQFDQLFTQNGPGWTGGDSAYSVRLPDGRTVWTVVYSTPQTGQGH